MSLWRFGVLAAAAHAQCVTKQLLSAGDGVTFPKPGDTVSMHYTGTLATTGEKFDSSRDRGKEFSTKIGVSQVIQGWDQGVPQMSLGEHAILRISAACGYGLQGSPPVIPPNADLVFDVELNGLNGRRAGAPMAPAVLPAMGISVIAPPVTSAIAPPAAALPRCITSSCGHAISWDTTGAGKPLCLCNPLCSQWAGTQGILPCCPGLQEVCLDPWRSPSPGNAATAPQGAALMNTAPVAQSAAPLNTPAARPAAMSTLPQATALPVCRPSSCGMGMASGLNSMTAVCSCDASCLAPGATLLCCQSFREVCQPAAAPAVLASAPVLQQQLNGASASMSASSRPASKPASGTPCTLGKMMWAEQPACDKKRWAIQGGKCKKVCPAIDTQSGIKFYTTGKVGKNACVAALALCN